MKHTDEINITCKECHKEIIFSINEIEVNVYKKMLTINNLCSEACAQKWAHKNHVSHSSNILDDHNLIKVIK